MLCSYNGTSEALPFAVFPVSPVFPVPLSSLHPTVLAESSFLVILLVLLRWLRPAGGLLEQQTRLQTRCRHTCAAC